MFSFQAVLTAEFLSRFFPQRQKVIHHAVFIAHAWSIIYDGKFTSFVLLT